MCLPRQQGGLGVMDPTTQQSALQLRWLHALMVAPFQANGSIALPYLAQLIAAQAPQDLTQFDYRLLIMFPQLRPSPMNRTDNPLSLILHAIDKIPKEFSQVVINAHTCLQLPLEAIYVHTDDIVLSRTSKRLLVSSTHTIDEGTQCIRHKQGSEIQIHPTLSTRFLRLVQNCRIMLQPFFIQTMIHPGLSATGQHLFVPVTHENVDSDPFLLAINLGSANPKMNTSPGQYRSKVSSPEATIRGTPSMWKKFWLMPLTHATRNIWIRIIRRKIPAKSTLHRLIPSYFQSPVCPICCTKDESIEHFLYKCPLKMVSGMNSWENYFSTPFSIEAIHEAIFELQFPQNNQASRHIEPAIIIASIITSIWRIHWTFVFNTVPFLS
ncbi:uncharacterized protein EV154DRAFT_569465 [Mucor mucedo]|uniref:uncharacterized protein n=1 Tax=Mucor mucedo TaxID=29922 RepID=UPI00221E7FDA|nr:uncharacterized protein EV154DRAFT_569465 [Mucor mucedo]KAI7875645.1 hypothetical protein EV154DRAFT_569465 [Mucor mucedo]